jgi:choline dehydrogenase-like flavoprotein
VSEVVSERTGELSVAGARERVASGEGRVVGPPRYDSRDSVRACRDRPGAIALEFTPNQLDALRAVANILFPSLEPEADSTAEVEAFWRRGAEELRLVDRLTALVDKLPPADQKDFARLLRLLASPLLGLTWKGPLKPFAKLTAEAQHKLLHSWTQSRFLLLRRGFKTLKRSIGFLAYTDLDGAPNPNWEALGYPGPIDEEPPKIQRLQVVQPDDGDRLACDVVVVGSGAGGGLAAGLLAEAGHDVILIEKGPYLAEVDFTGLEGEMIDRLYERHGALTTADGAFTVFAGSCLGGGTTVNWAASFRTPDTILAEWADEAILPHLQTREFQRGLEAIGSSLHVTLDESPDNTQNRALRQGSERCGQMAQVVPRNVDGCSVDGCRGCGYCGFGCRKGTKQSTMRTWIRRAAACGARIVPDAEVENVRIEAGEAVGVEARARVGDRAREFTVDARQVVVAAGSIHTPALLARSGIRHPELGRHLFFHPTVGVSGVYPEPVEAWHGAMMSSLNDAWAYLDGNHGFRVETAPAHPGLVALATPWTSGRQHKEVMLKVRNSAQFIVLTRDRHSGRVVWDRAGRPRLQYTLHPYDRKHLIEGVAAAARIHLAAGASRIYLPHASFPQFRAERGEAALDDLLQRYSSLRWEPHDASLFTAHQMGSCRMAGRRQRGVVGPDGAVWGVRNLYIADGSVLPSASGVNPMITIMGMAWHTIQELLARM